MDFRKNPVFQFLASVKLALPMILILAILLATGTIVEAVYSTPIAKRFVYGTWWFAGFLLLLGVNVFCSAISRYPWKKYQTGFVITHVGILCVLAGALMTQQLGTDGQIALVEGQHQSIFQEDKPTFYYQINDEPSRQFPASFKILQPSPQHPFLYHLENGGLLMIDQFLLNAGKVVEGQKAPAGQKGFPAIHLNLHSSFVQENNWLFLGSPDYGHLDLGPASVYFEKEGDWKKRISSDHSDVPANALAFLSTPSGRLKYQIRHKGQFSPAESLRIGKSYSTGWMDMQFEAQDQLPKAIPVVSYEPEPLVYQKEPESAIHYQAVQGSERLEGWLGFEDQVTFPFAGKTLGLAYGPRQGHLPFDLELKKFNLGFDPGTQKPASYASDVNYSDFETGTKMPATIGMNEPLHYRGYTIYQASYSLGPDGKYTSVFSVGRDPGLVVKYGGALIMVLGIIFMFWFKNPAWNKRTENALE